MDANLLRVLGAAAALFNVAAAGFSLWALRRLSAARLAANLIVPASQLFMVALSVAAALRADAGYGYAAVVCAEAIACALYCPVLCRGMRTAEELEAAKGYAHEAARALAAQREHLERAVAEAVTVEQTRERLQEGFSGVCALLEAGEPAAARARLSELTDSVPAKGFSRCRNMALDALLDAKAARAAQFGVRLDVVADVPAELGIPDMEACALLSNLLDNALAAVSALHEGRRVVHAVVRERQGLFVVQVDNPFQAPAESPRPRRPSADVRPEQMPEHGWGLSIVSSIVDSHGGSCRISEDGGVFSVRVSIPVS